MKDPYIQSLGINRFWGEMGGDEKNMIKHYCDKCGKEYTLEESKKQSSLGRVKRKHGVFHVEIMTAIRGTWNAATLCTPCVIEIVNKGKDCK